MVRLKVEICDTEVYKILINFITSKSEELIKVIFFF